MYDMEKASPQVRAGDRDRLRTARRLAVAHQHGYLDDDQLTLRLRNADEAVTANVLDAQVSDLPPESEMIGFTFSSHLTKLSDWANHFKVEEHSPFHYAGVMGLGALIAAVPTVAITTAAPHGPGALAAGVMVACLIVGILTFIAGLVLFACRCD